MVLVTGPSFLGNLHTHKWQAQSIENKGWETKEEKRSQRRLKRKLGERRGDERRGEERRGGEERREGREPVKSLNKWTPFPLDTTLRTSDVIKGMMMFKPYKVTSLAEIFPFE